MIDYRFADGTALVTGAASGIGEALAYALAERGSHLILLDRAADRLAAVAADVGRRHPAVRVETVVADLADHVATVALGARLAREHPELTLVINNAGVALAGSFTELSLDEFDWLMEINFRAVLTLTHALVPVLLQHPGSHLVNVSSVFGLIAPPTQSAYVTSKFAVRGLTESLRAELLGRVGVTCVHPGGIATRIAVDARVSAGADAAEIDRGQPAIASLLRIAPAVAADRILDGVRRRRPRVLIGASARVPDLAARIAPGSYGRVLALLLSAGRRRLHR
jgi:short-subunit dehydrogenase